MILILAFSITPTAADPRPSQESNPASVSSNKIVVKDSRGASLVIEKPAKRIIPIYGGFNEILFELGLGDSIVARAEADGDDPRLADLPSIGAHMRPSMEAIVAAEPDLVIHMSGRAEAAAFIDSLRSLGVAAIAFSLDSFNELFDATRKIGILTGKEKEAEELVASWRKRLDAIPKTDGEPVRTFFEIRYPDLIGAGDRGIVNEIIQRAGGENIVKIPKKMARLNEEIVISENPEAYIYQKGPMNPSPPDPAERASLKTVKAIRDGNVLQTDEKLFSRPGPGSVTATENLASFYNEIKKRRDKK